MKNKTFPKIKIALTFTISPGIAGAFLFPYLLLKDSIKQQESLVQFLKFLAEIIFFGFAGGMILFTIPAFFIGVFYASLGLQKNGSLIF